MATIATVAGKVAQAAGTAIPGLQALTGLLQTLAAEYQKYKDRETFARKLGEGAPYGKQILDFLIDDTPLIVNVHDGIWDAQEVALGRKPTSLARRLLAMAGKFKQPVAPSRVEADDNIGEGRVGGTL